LPLLIDGRPRPRHRENLLTIAGFYLHPPGFPTASPPDRRLLPPRARVRSGNSFPWPRGERQPEHEKHLLQRVPHHPCRDERVSAQSSTRPRSPPFDTPSNVSLFVPRTLDPDPRPAESRTSTSRTSARSNRPLAGVVYAPTLLIEALCAPVREHWKVGYDDCERGVVFHPPPLSRGPDPVYLGLAGPDSVGWHEWTTSGAPDCSKRLRAKRNMGRNDIETSLDNEWGDGLRPQRSHHRGEERERGENVSTT